MSWSPSELKGPQYSWLELIPILALKKETHEEFLKRVEEGLMERIRIIQKAPADLYFASAVSGVTIIDAPVLANGRWELLHFLREVAVSIDYHRYGNLGAREGELRKPIL